MRNDTNPGGDGHGPRTVQQWVVGRLQEAIVQGRLVPGQKLVYSDIAEEMNVSVTPVREAVKTLEALGMVTIHPHRTAYVSYLTEDQLGQLYELRILLEGLATQYAAERMTPREFQRLKEIYAELDRVVKTLNEAPSDIAVSEGIVSLSRLHSDFHKCLYSPCGNQYLLQMIDLLRSQVATYWPVINRYDMPRVNRSHGQHYHILEACEQGKPQLAARLLRSHLRDTIPRIVEHIRSDRPRAEAARDRSRALTQRKRRFQPGTAEQQSGIAAPATVLNSDTSH